LSNIGFIGHFECRTFGAHCWFNPIPASRPGLLMDGPSDLKALFAKK
jgi:hypothetical protein